MTLTTPPPPLDVITAFPEFAGLEKTTVRLHPRRGEPDVTASSLGGPLLWPGDEPWPVCESEDHADSPVPMVQVLQLYARDVPELPFPDGTDVLQLLWCPCLHDEGSWPLASLHWRTEATVTGPPAAQPELPDDDEGYLEDDYVSKPCVLQPERVREQPEGFELDGDLLDRVDAWAEQRGWSYYSHLGAATGTKVGGWADWMNGPEYHDCACGQPMAYLLTVADVEWDGASWRRWVPVEEFPVDRRSEGGHPAEAFTHYRDAGLVLADGSLYFFTCLTCPGRPFAMVHQS
ncbi:hypothetical protein [Winogradskya humida]|uniref:hypothetical protein n=1 Tax=Winogradskya humida TaxID=113566 RepID=UPI001943D2BB|nr:hypothetical protein [Actinoplanes humidus]